MSLDFSILATSAGGGRRGRMHLPHRTVETPVFMPVGTAGTVKAVAQDVLEALNLKMVTAHSEVRAVIPEDPTEAKLFTLLSNEPTHIDYIVRESGLPVAQVSSTLALMELKGMIRQMAGMQYVVARESGAREARADYTVE